MSRRYTKADLEKIVTTQLENLNAVHDLLSIMKHQNELLEQANKKLKDEISDFNKKVYPNFPADRVKIEQEFPWPIHDPSF